MVLDYKHWAVRWILKIHFKSGPDRFWMVQNLEFFKQMSQKLAIFKIIEIIVI